VHETSRSSPRFPRTGLRLADVELDGVVPGVWRVLDRTGAGEDALLGAVLAEGAGYIVIPTAAIGERFRFSTLEDVQAAFARHPEDDPGR